jgi:Ca2+:H+ antiporter
MATASHHAVPRWTWIVPALATLLLVLKALHVVAPDAPPVLLAAGLLLGGSVFAAVHHAEVLALRLGEPFGSILLAVAVTVIEVALIASIMLAGGDGSEGVARETVFSAVMLVLNVVVGLCLVVGGQRHHEQRFRLEGAAASLATLGTLATLALVLPSHTEGVLGPMYSPPQLLFVGVVSLVLYLTFVFVQTVRHRDYFLDDDAREGTAEAEGVAVSRPVVLASLGLLPLSLVAVVLLAKLESKPLERAVAAAGLPHTVVGVVIAALVLLPEGIASVRNAAANRLQTSINLALGSALASIGLTIPAVAALSLALHQPLALGLPPASTVLLVLTLFVSSLTLGTGRTTVLQGVVHLVIGAVFLLLSAVP